MALNDAFIKNSTKYRRRPTGDKRSDGGGLYLHVTASGRYWRMNYRNAGKQKTQALGIYPAVSLKKAREGRDRAKERLASGIDPSTAKQDAKQAKKIAAANTYEALAREFHRIKVSGWSEGHGVKWLRMHGLDLFPFTDLKRIFSTETECCLDPVPQRYVRDAVFELANPADIACRL